MMMMNNFQGRNWGGSDSLTCYLCLNKVCSDFQTWVQIKSYLKNPSYRAVSFDASPNLFCFYSAHVSSGSRPIFPLGSSCVYPMVLKWTKIVRQIYIFFRQAVRDAVLYNQYYHFKFLILIWEWPSPNLSCFFYSGSGRFLIFVEVYHLITLTLVPK